MAIITRLNIIFAILKLSYFLINPSPTHMQTVNKIMNYLLGIYILGLKFRGGDKLKIVINASFINNISDQKNSQGYTIRLFGGLIT